MNYPFNLFKPFGAVPDERQIYHMNLEKKAFFHFGINTFTGAEWGDGKERLDAFDLTFADTDQWIRTVKDAGFKLAILTAKHHDGFCLWPSKYSKHTVRETPYMNGQGDLVGQFVNSCRKYGVKVGLYLSPWDRHSELWGTDAYSELYADQLRELVTQYGEIDEIWWDGAGSTETEYNWKLWSDIISEHQPRALIFGSLGATEFIGLRWVGNERGFAGKTHYASIDSVTVEKEITRDMNTGKILGERYIPAEVDVSVRPGWFYHQSQTISVKTPVELDDIWFHSVGRNAIMLLNFPPNTAGVISEPEGIRALDSHRRIEKMLAKDFARGASAASCAPFNEDTGANNLFDGSTETFFAPANEQKSVSVDITLAKRQSFNTLALGEVFELGERIVDFSLLNLESGEVICKGTSVGRQKFVRFESVTAQKLRLEVNALAVPLLRFFSLYCYQAPDDEYNSVKFGSNLLEFDGSTIELSEDKKAVRLAFGGIYDYNRIEFFAKVGCEYEIFSFDGTQYNSIKKLCADSERVVAKLEQVVKGSYQVKIVSSDCEFSPNGYYVGLDRDYLMRLMQ